MLTEENKALVREVFEELFSKGNLALADQAYAPDYVGHDPANPEPLRGPEGVKQDISRYRRAFPDLRFTVEDLVAEGDKVVARVTVRGTHQGELMGIAPTGKRAEVTGISIVRFAGGKIAEEWGNWDTLGLLQQIGAVPAQDSPGARTAATYEK